MSTNEYAELLRKGRIDGEPYIRLHDAAKSLGIAPDTLSGYESARVQPTRQEAERILMHYKRVKNTQKNRVMVGSAAHGDLWGAINGFANVLASRRSTDDRANAVQRIEDAIRGLICLCTLCQQEQPLGSAWFCGECFAEQETERANWQAQAERAADARRLAVGERNSMEATIVEQKRVNNDLAFRLGGLKWEVEHCRRLLRAIADSIPAEFEGPQAEAHARTLNNAIKYLASVPQTEQES